MLYGAQDPPQSPSLLHTLKFHNGGNENGALLARLITQELVQVVEDALCLLNDGLHLFDLPLHLERFAL
jgi:hypothetical protein